VSLLHVCRKQDSNWQRVCCTDLWPSPHHPPLSLLTSPQKWAGELHTYVLTYQVNAKVCSQAVSFCMVLFCKSFYSHEYMSSACGSGACGSLELRIKEEVYHTAAKPMMHDQWLLKCAVIYIQLHGNDPRYIALLAVVISPSWL